MIVWELTKVFFYSLWVCFINILKWIWHLRLFILFLLMMFVLYKGCQEHLKEVRSQPVNEWTYVCDGVNQDELLELEKLCIAGHSQGYCEGWAMKKLCKQEIVCVKNCDNEGKLK